MPHIIIVFGVGEVLPNPLLHSRVAICCEFHNQEMLLGEICDALNQARFLHVGTAPNIIALQH